ncbi:MAG: hypothetical protein ACM3JC_17065 [Rudaea sp.]
MRRRVGIAAASLLAALASAAAAGEPAPLTPLRPTTKTYAWRVAVPVWTTEREVRRQRVYAPTLHPLSAGYALAEFRRERRLVGVVPEFSCKYPDAALPNECRTTWRRVYAEVPVAVVRHDRLTFDVPQWSWQDVDVAVDVPRLAWREETLVVSLPALDSEP